MKPETRNFLVYQLPAILWASVVLLASSDAFSGAQTGRLLEAILNALLGHLPHGLLVAMHLSIRKLAHLAEYGILAWLLYRARAYTQRVWDLRWAGFALVGVVVIAVIDELHQHFVPSRVGSPIDVAIDVTGAMVALVILKRLTEKYRKATPVAANQ